MKKEQLDSQPRSAEEPNSPGGARQGSGTRRPLLFSRPQPLPHYLVSLILDMELDRCRGKGEQSQMKESNVSLAGLGWTEAVVPWRGGAVVSSLDSGGRKGEQQRGALCVGLWLESARPMQLLLRAPLPPLHFLIWSRLLCPCFPDPRLGEEQGQQSACVGGALVACVLP